MVVKLLSGVAGGIIGVTEPRRVAAVCMARRVAEEMNLTSRFAFFSGGCRTITFVIVLIAAIIF